MPMGKAIEVIVRLAEQGAFDRYAIAGAVAALNYIEPTSTQDIDILISTAELEHRRSGLILLAPVEKALARMGYTERSDVGIVIEGWPVQFLPVASALDQEAVDEAIELEVSDDRAIKARCLRAEHVVATAVKVGRPQDWVRISMFLSQNAVDLRALGAVLKHHGLMGNWSNFCLRSGIKNPLNAA